MFVKNTSEKTIGFGSLILLPGASDTLPTGFDEKHPTVKFYIERGWLTPTIAPATQETPPNSPPALSDEEKAAQDKAAELDKKIKALNSMNLDPLRTLATELGIEFTPTDTKDTLKQKITEKYQAE